MPKKLDSSKIEKKEEAKEKVELKEDEATESTEEVETAEVIEEKEETTVAEPETLKEEKPKKKVAKKAEEPKQPIVKRYPHGKKYKKVAELIEKDKEYTIEEAIELIKKTATTKFDSSVEIHVNLNVDPANADHQVKGSVVMPAGLGKDKKVLVLADPDKSKEAKDAGADYIGGQDLVEKIGKGWLDFDVVVATPDMMPHVGKIGKILGTKGLMPNPKTGTVTTDVGRVVKEIKKGRANYKIDKAGILHSSVGKVSFSNDDLKANIEAFMDAIHHAKPASLKGTFIQSVHMATTMGPSVKIEK